MGFNSGFKGLMKTIIGPLSCKNVSFLITPNYIHTHTHTSVGKRRLTPPFGYHLAYLDKHTQRKEHFWQVNKQTKLAHITRSTKENGYPKRQILNAFRPVEKSERQHSSRNLSARPVHHLGGTIWDVYISQRPWEAAC